MSEPQPSRRVFLGLDRPPLTAGAEFLERTYPPLRDEWDLGELVVVLPLARDMRRLIEVLTDRAAELGVRLVPPTTITVGSLPETLYPLRRPVAGRLIQRLVWANVLREMDPATRARFLPLPPEGADDARWEQLGEVVARQHVELAAEGYTFAEVAAVAETLPGFDEEPRWRALAEAQAAYREELDRLGRVDPQDAMVGAVRDRACSSGREVVLMTSGMNVPRGVKNVVAQVADCVTVLIAAPEAWSEGYDAFGFVDTAWWLARMPDLEDGRLIVADDPAGQAEAVVAWLRSHGGRHRPDELTIGVADARLVPVVARRLAEVDVETWYAEGQALRATPPAVAVEAFADLLALREAAGPDGSVGDWAAVSALVRAADVSAALTAAGVPAGWLVEFDRYAAEHLPITFAGPFRGKADDHARLDAVAATLESWLDPWGGPARPVTAWIGPFRTLLEALYGHRDDLREGEETDRLIAEGLRALLAAAVEFTNVPERLAPRLTGSGALRAFLDGLEGTLVPTADSEAAIGLLGWLRLPRDDAEAMIVVGVNEGVVPSSASSDLFLPNALRVALEIDDNNARMARDAQALAVLAARYPDLTIVAARTDREGYPLRPSRLLLGRDEATMARRLAWFFDVDKAVKLFPELRGRLDPFGPGTPPEDDGPSPLAPEGRGAGGEGRGRPTANHDAPAPHPASGHRLLLREKGLPDGSADRDRTELPVPPPAGGRTVTTLSASAISAYLVCPYRFYLEKVQNLKALPDDLPEMEATHFGTLTHAVMEAFAASSFVRSKDPDALTGVFSRLLDEAVLATFGTVLSAAIRLQVEQVRTRLRALAPVQAALAAEGWRIAASELSCRADFPVDGEPFTLYGYIDRIDVHDATGDVRVLDYKTFGKAATPEQKHREGPGEARRWVNVQLPVYRLLAAARPEFAGRSIATGYLLLPQEVDKVGVSLAEWSEADYVEAEEVIRDVIRSIRAGVFWPPTPAAELKYPTDFDAICQVGVLDAWPGLAEATYPAAP